MALLQLGELLERQRVDRTEQPELTIELAHPGLGRDAVGKLRHRGRLGGVRFDIEVMAQQLNRRLQPQPGLGLVDLGPASPLPDLVQGALGGDARRPQLIEVGRQRAHLLALTATPLAELDVVGVEDAAMGIDQRSESVEHCERALDLDPALLGEQAGLGVGCQPAFGVVEAVLQELGPLGEPGGAHVEVAAAAGEDGGAGVELGTRLLAGTGGVGFGGFPGLQLGQQQLELGDPLALDGEVTGELVDPRLERLVLGLGLASGPFGGRHLLGRDAGTGGVRIALGDQVGNEPAGIVERGGSRCAPVLALPEEGGDLGGAGLGVGQGGRRDPAGGGTDAPAGRTEAIAIAGDDDGGGLAGGQVGGGGHARDAHRAGEQPIEQGGDTGEVGADVRPDEVAGDRRERHDRGVQPERQHGARGVRAAQRLERPPGGDRVADDDGGHGLPERGLDR